MHGFMRLISVRRGRQAVGGLLLMLVTLVGATLRLQAIAEPLWVDELHTGWVVSDRLSDIPSRAGSGNQASAYFYVVWLSTKVWGLTSLGLRFPSLAAGITLIPLGGWLVRRWSHSTIAGLLTATLIAIDRDFVFFGVEARVYALVQLVGLVHIAAFIARRQRSTWSSRAIWLGSGVLLFYLHYTTVLVIASKFLGQLLLAVWPRHWMPRRWRPRPSNSLDPSLSKSTLWSGTLLDLALFTVGVLPAVTHLAEVAERRRNWGESLSADPLMSLFPWGPCLAAPLLSVLIVAVVRRLRTRSPLWRSRLARVVGPLSGAILLPVLVAVVATELDQAQLQRYRYLILSATFLPIISGLLVALAPSRWSSRGIALVVLSFAFPASELSLRMHYDQSVVAARRENWSGAIDQINRDEAARSWPVLLCGGLVEDRQLAEGARVTGWNSREDLVAFCRFPLRSIHVLDRLDEDLVPLPTSDSRRMTQVLSKRIASAGGAWLVVRSGEAATKVIVDDLRDELFALGVRLDVDAIERLGGVTLVRLSLVHSVARLPLRGWPLVPLASRPT